MSDVREAWTVAACGDCYLASAGVREDDGGDWNEAAYLQAVGGCGAHPGSWPDVEWSEEDRDAGLDCEPYFDWAGCDLCGSTLGGDRYPVTLWVRRTVDA